MMSVQLAHLQREVHTARGVLADRRHGERNPAGVDDARAALLSALEDYTAALERERLPVPYALRDELRLARGCGGPIRL
jgi:hypothetical protein